MDTGARFIYVTAADPAQALAIGRTLVHERLAACANVLPGMTSVYRWQGDIEEAAEVPVLVKTRASRYPELETAIRELHPYELPEVIAVPIERGLPEYLEWVAEETAIPIG